MSGFNNIPPFGRESRRHFGEDVEKARLAARREGYAQHDDIIPRGTLTQVDQSSPMYIDEVSRFQTDAAREERERKMRMLEREKLALETARRREQEREAARARALDEKEAKERAHVAASATKKNQSGVAYNPFTLEYAPTPEGERLRQLDEAARKRAEHRSREIGRRMGCGTNPLTGEPMGSPSSPRRGDAPQS